MFQPVDAATHTARIFSQVEARSDASAVVTSWRRCLTIHKLAPDGALAPYRGEQGAVNATCEANADLIQASRIPMDRLLTILPSVDHMVFLTDAQGVCLETRSHRTLDYWERPRGGWIGSDFSEQAFGTCGIGTALHERVPVTIAGQQHFHVVNTMVICSGAPIYGPDGGLRGCLDISAGGWHDEPLKTSLMLATAVEVARRIEVRMFAAAYPAAKLVLASQTAPNTAALLAIDDDGVVVGATRAARTQLNVGEEALDGGMFIEQLWGGVSTRDLTIEGAERRAIDMALAVCKGNFSAAAKKLGVSRSTLHRKIAQYAPRRGGR